MNKKGFTLIELLIVIAIIAILAAVAFVALNPLQRLQDSRDAARWADVTAVLSAAKVGQVDNGGAYITAISNMTAGEAYMIGTAVAGCDDQNAVCDVAVAADGNCVDLSAFVTDGYLGEVPVSPNGNGTWTSSTTGYTAVRNNNGTLTVQACESENTDEIRVLR